MSYLRISKNRRRKLGFTANNIQPLRVEWLRYAGKSHPRTKCYGAALKKYGSDHNVRAAAGRPGETINAAAAVGISGQRQEKCFN